MRNELIPKVLKEYRKRNHYSVKDVSIRLTEVVRFDVHLHMSREGQRYIERISEIVPDTESPEGYRIVELVRFDGERYVKLHTISETTRAEMVKWLTKEEKEAFFNVDI